MTRVPIWFRMRAIPEEEQPNAGRLETTLSTLRTYYDRFSAALALFDHATERQSQATSQAFPNRDEQRAFRRQCTEWQMIAGRDAAITLYNFREGMDAATSWLQLCPTLAPLVTETRPPKRYFDKHFGDIAALRGAISHEGEYSKSPAEIVKQSYTGSGALDSIGISIDRVEKLVVANGLSGRTLSFTAGGKIRSIEMSASSLEQLRVVLEAFESAFARAAEFAISVRPA